MSDILSAINNAFELINETSFYESIKPSTKYNIPVERLGAAKNTTLDPYPYEENKEDFYTALCAAYPEPSNREDWLKGVFALAFLVCVMQWPENEARRIRVAWENLATYADKTDNESQWQNALLRTSEKIKYQTSTNQNVGEA